MDQLYRISFRIGDSSFDIESTDKSWVEAKEKEYLGKISLRPTRAAEKGPRGAEGIPQALSQDMTINEFYQKFIKANGIASRPSIAVFFVYFLQRIRKKDTIETGDVVQCFSDVAYPNYNNLNVTDILRQARRKALLNYVNNLWSLTITGEDFVLNAIAGEKK